MNDIIFELASPEETDLAMRRLAELGISVGTKSISLKFNEDQPRDEHGRWTDGSGFSGAESFVNPRDDKDVQKYLELQKIYNGPSVPYGEPGYEEYQQAKSDYRNAPQHVVDRARMALNLENKAQDIANSRYNEEAGLTADQIEAEVTGDLQKFVDENPVAVQIPFSRLDSVLDNGVQSMYETGTRGGKRGEFYQEVRSDAEAAFYGYNSEDTPAEQRPVYGFVKRPDDLSSDGPRTRTFDAVGTYGNTTVILKDSVRDNTTVTVDDSLEMYYSYRDILPTPINNVTLDSVSTNRVGFFIGEDRNIPFAQRPFTYVEAQIHGGVEPSDIESVILPKEPTKALAAKMDGLGITYTVKTPDTKSIALIKDWSEELHPRDELGRFTSGGIGAVDSALGTLREVGKFYDFKPGQTFGQMASKFRDATWYGSGTSEAEKYLREKYQAQGMGRNNAIAQAQADLLRVDALLKQSESKERFDEYNNKILESETANDAAKSYIATQLEAIDYATKEVTNVIENGTVCVAVSEEVLREVLDDGRFKNQFETKTSNGTLDPGMRKVWESVITGAAVDEKPADRAIYGFMTNNNAVPKHDENGSPDTSAGHDANDRNDYQGQWRDMLSVNNPMASQYGSVVVELKDSVRDRTTATIGDSLRAQTVGLPVNEPVNSEGLLVAGLYSRTDRATAPMYTTRYIEAQVVGGVTVNDIARIHVDFPDDYAFVAEKFPNIEIVQRTDYADNV